jgi:hypothetical protein
MPASTAAGVTAALGRVAAVADSILYEGYLLYPYRRSSPKNKVRWQFGVLLPRGWAEAHGLCDASVAGSAESWWQQTECLIMAPDRATLHVRVRFLQLQRRHVEQRGADGAYRTVDRLWVNGREEFGFDEAVPREADVTVPLADLLAGERVTRVRLPAGRDVQTLTRPGAGAVARIVRRRDELSSAVRLSAQRCGPPDRLLRLRVRVENADRGLDSEADRGAALGRALIATHTLLAAPGESFVSLLEAPDWARHAVGGCRNVHTFPVLADRDQAIVLSSPIILYDYPQVAPESPGGLHDAAEIDEILSLRTLTLTEREKSEARATDSRAAAIVDRIEAMPPEAFARLHGAIRSRRPVPPASDG